MNIIKIPIKSKNYPKLLSRIHQPPKEIYVRGDNLDLFDKSCFAVVGTRKLTSYGKEAAIKITRDLVAAGFVIVSGLALGIDAIAHKTALDSGGDTIAVLGSGLNDQSIGPQTNLPLAKEILKKNGLLISEYPPGGPVYPLNFAIRDRIISGLCWGMIVIEADEKSGALITAKCALDQNREVFAIPGSIFSAKSRGTNNLIKKGAKLVSSIDDILEDISPNLKLNLERSKSISTKDPLEKMVLDILDERGALSADDIIKFSGAEASEVLARLSILELNGKIKLTGQKYSKIDY